MVLADGLVVGFVNSTAVIFSSQTFLKYKFLKKENSMLCELPSLNTQPLCNTHLIYKRYLKNLERTSTPHALPSGKNASSFSKRTVVVKTSDLKISPHHHVHSPRGGGGGGGYVLHLYIGLWIKRIKVKHKNKDSLKILRRKYVVMCYLLSTIWMVWMVDSWCMMHDS